MRKGVANAIEGAGLRILIAPAAQIPWVRYGFQDDAKRDDQVFRDGANDK